MEMTFNNYLYKLDSIIESAIFNYETEVMTEDIDESSDYYALKTAEKKEGKFKAVCRVIGAAIEKAWMAVIAFIDKMINKYYECIKYRNVDVEVVEDIKIYHAALSFDPMLNTILSNMISKNVSEEDIDKAEKYMSQVGNMDLDNENKVITFKKGSFIKAKDIIALQAAAKNYKKLSEKALKAEGAFSAMEDKSELVSRAAKVITRLSGIVQSIVAQGDKIVDLYHKAQGLQKELDDNAKKVKKAEKEAKKAAKKNDKEPTNESADLVSALLSTASALLESVDDEDPVAEFDDEYPADNISGGEGEKIDHEEIKDLINDDEEALAILTDDEGSATVHENVVITF